MDKPFKTQDECDTEHAVGTLQQMVFFDALQAAGISQEQCIQILMDAFSLPKEKAVPLLYRIGRQRDYEEPIPDDVKTYLVEKGRFLL